MGVTEEIGRIMRSFSKSFSRKTKSKACGSTHEVVSVNTQPDLEDNNLTATMTEKYAEIEGLRAEIDSEAGALKTQLEIPSQDELQTWNEEDSSPTTVSLCESEGKYYA
ncbi:uncharacterized protein LOC111867342 isoform X2 [Cryptotermes secundus]|uniref:uncharacterized protein LOC111867342 isoform X2 n=1 Tax=Cryptotermes secundus TaxID=105785 RepID=UPI000CD7B904|nr:uncharacterized protein LOC111867342 isoform X2 [Cryptotermes secundus]